MQLKYNKSKIRQIEVKLNNLFKSELQRKKLVDTGKLLNSIDAKIDPNTLSWTMSSENYWKYLDNEYNLTKDALNSPQYQSILLDFEELIADAIMDTL